MRHLLQLYLEELKTRRDKINSGEIFSSYCNDGVNELDLVIERLEEILNEND